MKRTRIGCVLMAAGNSTRFGGNKLLTDFFGKTLIERAMEAIPRDKLCRAAVVSQYDEALSMALDFDYHGEKRQEEMASAAPYGLASTRWGMWTPPCSW
ncbi:MAG: NTP transferase domain-containing protein [Christensenellales bacterium]